MSMKMNLKSFQHHKDLKRFPTESQTNQRNVSNKVLPLVFPSSKPLLWDMTPMGDSIGLHISYYRNPRLLLSEKALRLSYRHAKTERIGFSCFLLGSFSIDEDEEGVTITIDRFDPGREKSGVCGKVPTTVLPGDFVVTCSISTKEAEMLCATSLSDDFTSSLKGLQSHLHSKEALDLSKLFSLRAHLTFTEHMDNLHFDLHWAAATVANPFESTPIKPIPIIPTALARNLSSHNNIAQLQGTHKCGYLTMDQTRKLLLVLESDPKVYTLPLVGIWLSGVTHIHSPQVWASCLRYMYSSSITERVLSESGSFLVVLYSLTHKEPEFYECALGSGQDSLSLQLLTCEEALHLFKNVEASRKQHLQFELTTECQNSRSCFINEVSKSFSAGLLQGNTSPSKLSISDQDSGLEDEDFSPRPSPRPHPSVQQATRIHPSVPELSLVFGSFIDPKLSSQSLENGSLTTKDENHPLACAANPSNEKKPAECQPSNSNVKLATNYRTVALSRFHKGKQSPYDKQPTNPKVGNQIRGNPASSSSSSISTPQSGSSPDNTLHHMSGLSDINRDTVRPHKVPAPTRLTSTSSRQTASPLSPNHNVTFPLQSRRLSETSKPFSSKTPFYQTNCCHYCHNCTPVQHHATGSWPSTESIGYHTMENTSETVESFHPAHHNTAFSNISCSPVCAASCSKTPGQTSRVGCCSSPVDLMSSPGRKASLPVNLFSPSSCIHTPPPNLPNANAMLGLSAEAYRLLADQDKQLKVLQAQIKRLLEAQTLQSELPKVCASNGLSQTQGASLSTEKRVTGKKQSVSIAVSTGASLFWNSPEGEESVEKPDASDLCHELSVAINNEEDTSHTSITSSLQAVDICSFSETSQLEDSAKGQSLPHLDSTHVSSEPGSPLLQRKLPPESSEWPGTAELAPPPEKLYQDMLCQVNNLLKTSEDETEESRTGNRERERTCEPQTKEKKTVQISKSSANSQNVLKATIEQLKSIGVNIDFDSSHLTRKNTDTADSASVLACINPDAVIPRLNYMSFTNIGLSGFAPSGVDLSMEANAIALKYLSESQLRQLSLSHGTKSNPLDSSTFHSFLPGNNEKSMVGLSLISPNNMSFATKKYMKRYGLIESNDSSDDESLLPSENSSDLIQAEAESVVKNRRCSNPSYVRESLGQVKNPPTKNMDCTGEQEIINQPEAHKLRNITNEISRKTFVPVHHSEDMSLQVLKDLKTNSKLSSGKVQITRHPEKENAGDPPFFSERDSTTNGKKLTAGVNLVGDILDVNRLRQLPKLF
ncbi:SCL-interrupting locus protein [Bombina bombina]|uniref:SCL-interrupting locus protein n=1 Tax=Bombina bombina TaxID=8345 RepID=UPI00235A8D98|nr:SCL-interrupting locus protein [Bombina bombina]